ncbi:DNA-directed RNA polymerase subunit delta [Pradoshia eiseniae]|uniref:Probable DNA-directed RNA polymerase subunit delta n=1 Tax=Pradoshia eiseniae TaxID=2064768 RepID=A0A2S7N257_9BACI|nr:DNA-directed RNA polymerase subunit delta [Pradoshia eiseniae]PQD96088.1 DNA-directed RNA polymerase subunit delta [Pradoshia eiseniae]
MTLAKMSVEDIREMAFIEIANLLLIEKKEAIDFKVMMDEIQKLLGLSNEEVAEKIGQFYTDLNVDGRFISIGDNRWGLKGWYPVEQVEEETVPASKVKKKKGKKVVDDDDLVDFDAIDEDDEDLDFDDIDDYDDDDDDEDLIDDDFDEDVDDDDDDLIEDEEEIIKDKFVIEDDEEEEEEEEDFEDEEDIR